MNHTSRVCVFIFQRSLREVGVWMQVAWLNLKTYYESSVKWHSHTMTCTAGKLHSCQNHSDSTSPTGQPGALLRCMPNFLFKIMQRWDKRRAGAICFSSQAKLSLKSDTKTIKHKAKGNHTLHFFLFFSGVGAGLISSSWSSLIRPTEVDMTVSRGNEWKTEGHGQWKDSSELQVVVQMTSTIKGRKYGGASQRVNCWQDDGQHLWSPALTGPLSETDRSLYSLLFY